MKKLLFLGILSLSIFECSALDIFLNKYETKGYSARGARMNPASHKIYPDEFTVGDLRKAIAEEQDIPLELVVVSNKNSDPNFYKFNGQYFFNIDEPDRFDRMPLKDFWTSENKQILYSSIPDYLEHVKTHALESQQFLEQIEQDLAPYQLIKFAGFTGAAAAQD